MNKQEFISKLKDIGFINMNVLVISGIFFNLDNIIVKLNKQNINIYEFKNSDMNSVFTISTEFDNTFDITLNKICNLPEIQYFLRTKKLNKIFK